MIGAGSPSTTNEAGPSTLVDESGQRPQAEPLPAKRGEIGYIEPKQPEETESSNGPTAQDTISPLPAVHPADRGPTAPSQSPPAPAADSASTHSTHSSILKRLKPKHIPSLGGVRFTTLFLFLAHLAVLGGTIAGWVLITNHLSKVAASASSSSNDSLGAGSSEIFVHVAFGVACLAELIFIERRIFRIRAERYCHTHNGLPMHRRTGNGDMAIGFAPWSRPPLPTYAAALAQSGVGTGDVEDNAIAVLPPPAYGNTRGSTLLLSGFVSDTLRVQRQEARARAVERANTGSLRDSLRQSWLTQSSRPVSYRSHDGDWEERCDAMRAAQLENTLATLEEARTRD